MNIASPQFLAFAVIAALLFRFSAAAWWRAGIFLIANLGFLATFSTDPRWWLPLTYFVIAGYLGLRALQRWGGRWCFLAVLIATVAGFFWLKKYSFIPQSALIAAPYATVGLSYMFFRLAQLLIDTHGHDIPEPIGPVRFLNYMINFTTLVSGPIQRFQDFAEWPMAESVLTWNLVGAAVERVIIGFFKVAIISALLLLFHQHALDTFTTARHFPDRVADAILAGSIYTFYLYYNFAGSMDIVIGIAHLFGSTLPENFDHPFAANNFLDFWRRWHMTLSNWLRYYIYNPLLMKLLEIFPSPKIAPLLGVVAIFVTFFLIGLWHGQTGVFALYGLLLGLGVGANMLYQTGMSAWLGRPAYRELSANIAYQLAARGLTFAWFTLSLFCFWADWDQLSTIWAAVGVAGMAAAIAALAAVAALAFALLEALQRIATVALTPAGRALSSRYARTVYATTLATIVAGAMLLLTQSAPTIVYEKF